MTDSAFSFCKKYKGAIVLVTIILFLFLYSLPLLTTKPRLSYDEGFFIEEAHNFEQFGKLDIFVSPNSFSGLPHIASSSGFPGEIPLALFFKLFGFGLEQARVYALLWMAALLIVSYFFAKRLFGTLSAIGTILLIVTFPPFHNNGRMAMGDIPGFTYLILGLLFLSRRFFLSGLFMGLSMISRPSVYVGAFIGVGIETLYTKGMGGIRSLLFTAFGVSISVLTSIILYLPESLTQEWWRKTVLYIRTPTFGLGNTPGHNFIYNIQSFFSEETLVYFSILFLLIVVAFLLGGKREWNRRFLIFSVIYSLFVIAYFMKSPGWLKYLLPFQLLIFFYVPSALRIITEKVYEYAKNKGFIRIFSELQAFQLAFLGVLVLASLQLMQLFFFADIFASDDVERANGFLSERLDGTATVAFIHTSVLAALTPPDRKYSFNVVNENFFIGENPLGFANNRLVTYVVVPEDLANFSAQFQGQYHETLKEKYNLLTKIGRHDIYELKVR